VAELLKWQGYAAMCVGKWHLGDQPQFLPTRHGFNHYLGLPYSNDMGGSGKGNDRRPLLPLLRDQEVIEAPAQ
jgi:arylsulfatase A